MKQTENIKETDRRISEMLRENSNPLPGDEWFVRKVLNRLPPERSHLVSIPEVVAFLIVLTVSVIITVSETRHALSLTDFSTFNPSHLIASALAALCAAIYIAVPVFRRC